MSLSPSVVTFCDSNKNPKMIKGHSNLKCNLTFIVIYLISVYYINLTCFNH